jgi:hypothetical protein
MRNPLKYFQDILINYNGISNTISIFSHKVQGGSFSPKKSGPFAMPGRGVNPKPQSARARMTSHAQSQNVKTVVSTHEIYKFINL